MEDRLIKTEEKLRKLSETENENKREIERLRLENILLKAENDAFENGKLIPLSEDNKILEERVKHLKQDLYSAEEEKIRLKNENERLCNELTICRERNENMGDLYQLRSSVSALQELRFQNEGKIKVRIFDKPNFCLNVFFLIRYRS